MNKNKWVVQVEEDKDSGELVLPLPVDMLAQLGWSEGTDLFWIDNHNGTFTLTDKAVEVPDEEIPPNNEAGC